MRAAREKFLSTPDGNSFLLLVDSRFMKKYLAWLLLASPLAGMDLPGLSLQSQWENEIRNIGSFNDGNVLLGKHVIFFPGIINEVGALLGLYFTDNMETVEKELGGTASYFGPSSELSIPENVEIIHNHILKTANEQRKPLILVGHSKGGAEVLQTILRYPELILQGMVFQVLLIQPALQGSPLAERTPGCLFDLFKLILKPNLATLDTFTAKEDLREAFLSFEKSLKSNALFRNSDHKILENQISSRIFYVQSQVYQDEISFGVSIVLMVLQHDLSDYNGNHDGLLPLSSQSDDRIGVNLGVVYADHIGLTISKLSNVTKHERHAFTRLVFRILAEAGSAY